MVNHDNSKTGSDYIAAALTISAMTTDGCSIGTDDEEHGQADATI